MSSSFFPGRDVFERAAEHATSQTGSLVAFESAAQFNDELGAARFRLDNGLAIVLMPDRRAPVFTYQSWFKVGSRDEDPQRTGLAHLFEHLMFKGTETFATGEFDAEMERRGAETNAATWVDWTHYTVSLAARDDNLETVIRFETDRMTRLILDEATFRSELEVVKNERRQSVEDNVMGTLGERLFALAYREHPYRWPTIGYMSHLEATQLDELRSFYRAFYAPNNAVIVVAGDIDVDETLALLARGYGPLSAQPQPPRSRPAEPRQDQSRLERIQRQVAAPVLLIGYHAPHQMSDDFPALEMLADALSIGDSARLYRRVVTEEELATDVECYISPFAEAGLFEVFAVVRPGVDPEHVVAIIQEELDRACEGLSARELQKARNDLEVSLFETFRDTEHCADVLGHYETNFDDYSIAFRALERVNAVNADDLKRVAAQVFRADNRSAVIASL